jgi:tetratricopeptide (TPR) repeat protein
MGAVLIGSLCAPEGVRAAGESPPAACATSSPGAEEVSAKSVLEQDPASVDARLKLAAALSDRGCYADSVKILEAGVQLNPRSRALQERLRSARSTLSEQGYFEGLGHAEEAAKTQRNAIRCRELGDIAACDQALAGSPGDRDLLIAKGDALVRVNRPVDALPLYEKAASVDPADDALKAKISATERARLALVSRCQTETGDAAIAACDLGLRRGVHDEFGIYKRKGILLQGQDQPSRALDAYIAASLVDPSDRSVALAIMALTDSTGRQDPLALSARGSALLTLGRAADSIATLRKAETLAGATPEVRQRLAAAEQLASNEPLPPSVAARRKQTPSALPAPSAARPRPVSSPMYSNAAPAGESH